MRVALLACVLLCAALSGCKKKTATEFYRLEGEHSVLVTREGDAAYETTEMENIIAGLRAIPADTVEKPRAEALLGAIAAEQARVQREKVVVNTPPPTVDDVNARYAALKAARDNPVVNPEPPPAPDAGAQVPTEPYKGMAEAEFIKVFGSCYERGAPVVIADGGLSTSMKLRADAKCQQQFGTPGATTRWLFGHEGLYARLVETEQRQAVTVDAGAGEQTTKPTPAPDPKPSLVIPGAPLPGSEAPTMIP
ncbi:MAG: hypothetical protein ACO1OB_00750 [Archangium sp.]